jgi:MFS family permease
LSRSRWFLFSTFLFWTALYVYVPILAPYARDMNGSMTVVGFIIASYGFMQLLFRIPLGIWSDRTGRRKPFLHASLLMLAGSALGLAWSPTPEWMIAARALGGLAACSWVVWSVMYVGFFPKDRMTAAMSHLAVCSALGQMVSTYAGGWIADIYGWTTPFYIGAVLSGLSILVLMMVPDAVRSHGPKLTWTRIVSIGTTRSLLTVALISALGQYVTFITIFGFTPVYAADIGADRAQLGMMTLIGLAGQTVAAYASGVWCAPRWGMRPVLVVGFIIVGTGTVMIPYSETVLMLYLAQLVGGLGRGLISPILMTLAVQSIPPEERGTAMGVYQAVYAIGMFSGPALGGVLGDWIGLSGVFLSTGLVCVIGAVWSMVLRVEK